MFARRRTESAIVLALLSASVPACAPGPANAPSNAASECSAVTDDPEELLLRYYRTSGSWCFRYGPVFKGRWYYDTVDGADEPLPRYGARFDPPDRVTHWYGCTPRKDAGRRSVKLGEAAEGTQSDAVRLLQFLNPELLAQQELTLLPSGEYASSDSCVLSGQLPTGEGITYVQSLGDGALQLVVLPHDDCFIQEQYPVKVGEPCVFPKCREYL